MVTSSDSAFIQTMMLKAYARTYIFWARAYGEPYSSVKPEFSDWQKGHNFMSYAVFPIGVYRYCIWSRYSNLASASASISAKEGDNGNVVAPTHVIGVPVNTPLIVVPANNITKNANASKANPQQSQCAGGCGSGACAAGSCGAAGCGGSCGGAAL